MHQHKHKHKHRGFSLLELAAVLAVTGILISVAVPSYAHFMQRQQLRLAADTLLQDLRRTRELSVNTPVSLFATFHGGPKWCWGISRGLPCDCAGNVTPTHKPLARCDIARGDNQAQFKDVTMGSAQDFEFKPGLGQAAQAGAVALHTKKGQSVQVVLNWLGRAHVCGQDAPGGQPC